MSEYQNPRPSSTTSAASPDALYDNTVTFNKLLNKYENQTTYQGKELISWQKAIELFGFGVAEFDFVTGGTLDSKNQLIRHSDELLYRYVGAGSFPLTVAAGTNPVGNPDWEAFAATSLQLLSGLSNPSELDTIHRTEATLSRLAIGDYIVGSKLVFPELGMAKFNVVSGGTPNGFDIRDAGNGNTAVIQEEYMMPAAGFGVSESSLDNTPAEQAMLDFLKTSICRVIQYPSGTLKYKCSENISQGSACVRYEDLSNIEFVGGVATTIQLEEGGTGAGAFYFGRIANNTRCLKFRGIEFYGKYSTTPSFQGQGGNRNGGFLILGWDITVPTQDSFEDYAVGGHDVIGCTFRDIGGAFGTSKKATNTFRPAYIDNIKIIGNRFIDAQQANNTVGGDFFVSGEINDNIFETTLPLSDTIWTIAIDVSRGCVGMEVARNTVSKYHYGIKSEYQLNGGINADELEYSELTDIHHNELLDMGHPTLDIAGGTNALGSYGIRLSGNNVIEWENKIVGLNNPAAAEPKRLVYGVFANQSNVTTSEQKSQGGLISNVQYGVVHASTDSNNRFTCSNKKIRDVKFAGIILHAGGIAEDNSIGRVGGPGINLQVADQTFARRNFIFDSLQGGGVGGAIFQEQSPANARYFEVVDNYVVNVNGGSGTAFSSVAGTSNTNSFIYRPGQTIGATVSGSEYVSDIREGTAIKATGLVNPQTLSILESRNILSVTSVDANTVQINFKKPMLSTLFSWDARNQNDASVRWIGFGATVNYLRLRSVDGNNSPVPLPSALMVTVF